MKFIIALTFFIISSISYAYEKQFVVKEILTDEIIKIEKLDTHVKVETGDILVIYSHQSKNILGYAVVQIPDKDQRNFTATIQTHNKSGIIRPENYLRKIELQENPDAKVPARNDLLYRGNKKVLAKYKPLVYAGLSQGFTAANLSSNEFIAGPSVFGYGLTSRTQVHTNLLSNLFEIYNFSMKNVIFLNDDFEFSIENAGQYYKKESKGSYSFTIYLDTVSNSNFNSLMKMKVFTKKPADNYIFNSEEYNKDLNLELSINYGYLFDNWNRLIFGPKIDVNKKKVGGTIGYYFINRDFHAMFGLSSNDFSEFYVGRDGYLFNLDFWWRF